MAKGIWKLGRWKRISAMALLLALNGCSGEVVSDEADSIDPFDTPDGVGDLGEAPSELDAPRPGWERPLLPEEEVENIRCHIPGVNDADRDGLADAEEVYTDPCVEDTDGDGVGDLIELTYADARCPSDRGACDCAIDAACQPQDFLAAVLPHGARSSLQTDFDIAFQEADIFFLLGNSLSMYDARTHLDEVLSDNATTEAIRQMVPGARVGVAFQEDFPAYDYGRDGDSPFTLGMQLEPRWEGTIADALASRGVRDGGDAAYPYGEALYQLFSGGRTWWTDETGNELLMIPDYGSSCPAGTVGAGCFRGDVLPIVVHITDGCAHDASSPECQKYERILEQPHTMEEGLAMVGEIGGRYVGLDASKWGCDEDEPESACRSMRDAATQTGSVDYLNTPIVRELGVGDSVAVMENVLEVIEASVQDVPVDVTAHSWVASGDPFAFRLIDSIKPVEECEDPEDPCFIGAPGVDPEDALGDIDEGGYRDLLPRSRVRFQVQLQNSALPEEALSQRNVVRIGALADRFQVDTVDVHLIVPASAE